MQYVHGGVFRCYYHHHYHHHVTTMAKMRKQKWKQKIHLFWPYYPSKSKKILFTHQPSKPNQTSIGWIFSSSSSCFWYFFFVFDDFSSLQQHISTIVGTCVAEWGWILLFLFCLNDDDDDDGTFYVFYVCVLVCFIQNKNFYKTKHIYNEWMNEWMKKRHAPNPKRKLNKYTKQNTYINSATSLLNSPLIPIPSPLLSSSSMFWDFHCCVSSIKTKQKKKFSRPIGNRSFPEKNSNKNKQTIFGIKEKYFSFFFLFHFR